ncbi:MAG: prolipoprotein diacylglyceryl transferase family protein, partial [Myxococcota bacterium]
MVPMRRTRPAASWVLLCLLFIGALAASPAEAAGRKALLIGINEYMAVPDLRGAVNDIELIRDVLVTRFGFQPGDVEMLTDEKATRDNMLAAFDRLAERSAPGDFVYLHYSGHGSQAQDTDGDEAGDSRDETLIPHDGRTGQIPDITDDELARAAAKLEGRQLVIVLDSCHSGTATRGAFVQPRAVPPVHRTQLYEMPWLFAVAALLWRRRRRSPFLFGEYMMLAGVGRFAVELLRVNPRVALGMTELLVRAVPSGLPRIEEIRLDLPMLLFALTVAVLAGLLFGGAAAALAGRGDVSRTLKSGARTTGSGLGHGLRRWLVTGQVAVAVLLAAAAALVTRSLVALAGNGTACMWVCSRVLRHRLRWDSRFVRPG